MEKLNLGITPVSSDSGKTELLRTSLRRFSTAVNSFALIVLLPTLAAGIYYALIASDVYIAEARYAIRSSAEMPGGGLIDSIFGNVSSGGSAGEDAMVVRDYILSRDMLETLDSILNLRQHYASDELDVLSRLDKDASIEDFLKYFRDMIDIDIETSSHISALRVRAFDPETAKKLGESIIEQSEALVNRMTERIIEDTLKFAREEVAVAEDNVRRSSDALTGFRSVSQSIDPGQETNAVLGIVTELESALAGARAELIQAEIYMNPESVQVKNLRARVIALERQVKNERQRLSANDDYSNDYTRLIQRYEPLALEKALAEQRYSSSLASLEAARTEAQRKQRYLISFVRPKLPDEAVEPDRLMAIATVFVSSLLVYAIGGLIWAAVKDHMRM